MDPARRLLLREGRPVALTPKMFETLLALVENHGRLVSKDELMSQVWSDVAVEESGLTRNISVLRKALGESLEDHCYIVTVPGAGYKFVADVSEIGNVGADLIVEEHSSSRIVIEEEGLSDEQVKESDVSEGGLRYSTRPRRTFRSTRRRTIAIGATLAGCLAACAGIYELAARGHSATSPAFTHMSITSLVKTGKPVEAAISPDGKYVAYVAENGGEQSLLVRQVVSANNVQIVPPAEVHYQGVTFSRDGNFVYYVVLGMKETAPVLYQVPVLGGDQRRLIARVNSSVTFSPDGDRMAFVRVDHGVYDLIVANADGSSESTLATRKLPEVFWKAAWSPDGRTIACSAGHLTGGRDDYMNVVEIRVADGVETPVSPARWNKLEQIDWLADGRALVVVGIQSSGRQQIWLISRANGEAQRVTNDLNSYAHLSVTANGSALVTVSDRSLSSIWVVPAAGGSPAQIQIDNERTDSIMSVCWTPDGRIVYATNDTGNRNIRIIEVDGSHDKQLTFDHHSGEPSVSPDGRYLVFASDRSGVSHIWRMDLDGGNIIQLTAGVGEGSPQCSPNSKWVVFDSRSGERTLWKVSIDGGEPVQLCAEPCAKASVSPDGKNIVCYGQNRAPDTNYKLALVPFSGGQQTKLCDLPGTTVYSAGFKWMPDGRGITYVDARADTSNVWTQPLGGATQKQLTDFSGNKVYAADWSRDGKQLVCSCATTTREVVLICNLN